jgi:hypothetical protein
MKAQFSAEWNGFKIKIIPPAEAWISKGIKDTHRTLYCDWSRFVNKIETHNDLYSVFTWCLSFFDRPAIQSNSFLVMESVEATQ